MPVTKTAKRALRGSIRKTIVNKEIRKNLEIAIRLATKSKNTEKIIKAISLTDRAVKKNLFHKNKAARIKSRLSKLLPKKMSVTKKTTKKQSSKK